MRGQIVVPVHSSTRPVRRAVESVLDNPEFGVVLVAHGVDPQRLDFPAGPRVEVVEVREGVGYPGVAFNRGFEAATADCVGVLGTDDWYEPGALTRMLEHAAGDGADGVLAPQRRQGEPRNTGIPAAWNRKNLRAAKDRLFWRSSPLGIYKKGLLGIGNYRFDETVKAGVDQLNGALLWTAGHEISYYPNDPAYVVGDGSGDRVSTASAALSVHSRSWETLWDDKCIRSLSLADRRALANRMLTVNVFSVLIPRVLGGTLDARDLEWLSVLSEKMTEVAPGMERTLSLGHRRIFRALLEGDAQELTEAVGRASFVQNRLPSHPSAVLSPHFWLRSSAAARVNRLRGWFERREA